MQAWNSVKVNNPESLHTGRAGTVLRVERKNGLEVVQVWLDAIGSAGEEGHKPAETEPFAAQELQLL